MDICFQHCGLESRWDTREKFNTVAFQVQIPLETHLWTDLATCSICSLHSIPTQHLSLLDWKLSVEYTQWKSLNSLPRVYSSSSLPPLVWWIIFKEHQSIWSMIMNVFDILHVRSKLFYLRRDELITAPFTFSALSTSANDFIIVDEIYCISQMGRSHLKNFIGLFVCRNFS